jgi:hypothetical protein
MSTEKEAVLDRLRRQRAIETNSDVVALHEDWLRALDDLMNQFRSWLSEAEAEGLFVVSEYEAELTEAGVGTYPVKDLILTTPKGETIQIVPIGRLAAGTYGRVDLKCPPKRHVLVRDESSRWQFARLVPGNNGWAMQDLTEESFWQAIGDLIS